MKNQQKHNKKLECILLCMHVYIYVWKIQYIFKAGLATLLTSINELDRELLIFRI